jgi:hypothetical protein
MKRERILLRAAGAVFLGLCLSPPPAAAGEIDDLRALIEQQRKAMEGLERRVQDLEKGLAAPKGEPAPAGREAVVVEPSGSVVIAPAAPPVDAAPKAQAPGDLLANTVRKGDFPRSFQIPGSNISLRIAGYVRFDGIYDDGALGSGVRYFPDTIGVEGTPQAADAGVTRLSAGQTRLSFEAQAPREFGRLRAYVEADFFGVGDNFKMRHAYGEVHGFLAGYSWTTLMDLRALPQTVAFTAPVGAVYRPQGLVRYRRPLAKGLAVSVSVENPTSDVATGPGERALRRWPDLVANFNYAPAPSRHLQLGGIFRRPGVETSRAQTQYANGWGISLSGHLATVGKDELKAGGLWGNGIGSYVAGFATSPSSAAFSPAGRLEALPGRAGFVAYQHYWSQHFRSTAMYGISRIENLSSEPGSALHETETTSANLIWSPAPGFGVGLEYMWGRRQNKNGAEGKDPRVQLGVQFGY